MTYFNRLTNWRIKIMQLYLSFIENEIKKFYNTLSEKAKRLYAAVEALKIGHGGIKELTALSNDDSSNDRIRKPGGGRKPYYVKYKAINEQFLNILKDYTAGDPSNKDVIWTNLTQRKLLTESLKNIRLVSARQLFVNCWRNIIIDVAKLRSQHH